MLILGHRGVVQTSPYQNSLLAFQQAVDAADGFETDACVTKDGKVFLIHEDPAIGAEGGMGHHLDDSSRNWLGDRRMESLTGDEVRGLRLRDGQPIPSLQQAIDLVGSRSGKLLNIELKAYNVVDAVLAVARYNLDRGTIKLESLLLSSFNHYALQTVRQQMPQLKVGALFVSADVPAVKLFPMHPDDPAVYVSLIHKNLMQPMMQNLQPDMCIMPEKILTAETLRMIETCLPNTCLMAWGNTEKGDFNGSDLMARLKQFPQGKVAAMIVDHPAAFVEAMRNR